jgi:tetratricopeptide (TPR) repeat protein
MPRPSLLDVADRLSEHSHEHAHSPTLALLLSQAYKRLAARDYNGAECVLAPYLAWPMAQPQQLRVRYLQASAARHRRQYHTVIACCEEAIVLCQMREWRVEYAQLALLCAEAYHNLGRFSLAAVVAAEGLAAWLSLGPSHDQGPHDLTLEVDLRDRLSVDLFLLGEFPEALQHARLARHLTYALPATPAAALRVGGLEWTMALVQRWRGAAHDARQQILSILPTYERFGAPDELARLRIVAADIALDALAPLGQGIAHHYRDDLVRVATTNLALARETIEERNMDPSARAMARLAQTRLSRLLGANEDRVAHLEALGRFAEQTQDLPLLGQVYTALGDEFGAAGRAEVESQLSCYRRAVGVIAGSETPAYGVWAHRGLLWEAEGRP